jgi:Arc/MetJ-type ribon-helix-helix transcriptional regulator
MKTTLSISVEEQTIKKILSIVKDSEGRYRNISHYCEEAIQEKLR